jgi:hypothetical protein
LAGDGKGLKGQARAVQIDIAPEMLSLRYPMEVNLVGDSAETLRALLPLLDQGQHHAEHNQSAEHDGRSSRIRPSRFRLGHSELSRRGDSLPPACLRDQRHEHVPASSRHHQHKHPLGNSSLQSQRPPPPSCSSMPLPTRRRIDFLTELLERFALTGAA